MGGSHGGTPQTGQSALGGEHLDDGDHAAAVPVEPERAAVRGAEVDDVGGRVAATGAEAAAGGDPVGNCAFAERQQENQTDHYSEGERTPPDQPAPQCDNHDDQS